MSDSRTKCPECGHEWGSSNFPLYKCDNCQTVTCPRCRRNNLCQKCRRGQNRKIR